MGFESVFGVVKWKFDDDDDGSNAQNVSIQSDSIETLFRIKQKEKNQFDSVNVDHQVTIFKLFLIYLWENEWISNSNDTRI